MLIIIQLLTEYVACPIKLESPNISSSWRTNLSNARCGLATSKSHDSFHTGLRPLSALTQYT